mmetsp:Transcript_5266/g.11943  ORF Transcript_5266/g.11943 Transcript_5266/m.11943 type:complete len:225 (-) Transcript_5266:266-940(-)
MGKLLLRLYLRTGPPRRGQCVRGHVPRVDPVRVAEGRARLDRSSGHSLGAPHDASADLQHVFPPPPRSTDLCGERTPRAAHGRVCSQRRADGTRPRLPADGIRCFWEPHRHGTRPHHNRCRGTKGRRALYQPGTGGLDRGPGRLHVRVWPPLHQERNPRRVALDPDRPLGTPRLQPGQGGGRPAPAVPRPRQGDDRKPVPAQAPEAANRRRPAGGATATTVEKR